MEFAHLVQAVPLNQPILYNLAFSELTARDF